MMIMAVLAIHSSHPFSLRVPAWDKVDGKLGRLRFQILKERDGKCSLERQVSATTLLLT